MNAPKTLGFGSAQHEIFDAVQHCSADNQGLLYGPPTTHTEKSFSQLPCDSPTSHIQLQEQTGPWTNSRVPLWSRTGATPHGSRPEVRTAVRGRGAAPPAASHKGAAVRRTDGDSDIRLAGLDAATRIPAPGPEPGPTRTQAATRRRRRRRRSDRRHGRQILHDHRRDLHHSDPRHGRRIRHGLHRRDRDRPSGPRLLHPYHRLHGRRTHHHHLRPYEDRHLPSDHPRHVAQDGLLRDHHDQGHLCHRIDRRNRPCCRRLQHRHRRHRHYPSLQVARVPHLLWVQLPPDRACAASLQFQPPFDAAFQRRRPNGHAPPHVCAVPLRPSAFCRPPFDRPPHAPHALCALSPPAPA
mmetsp:Transcript_52608/g.109756  ORF Transcript_52608/g.109756 Transcript_52608/m.109756 type:complete len:353 (-) Transcript_52608:1281-2339(-)